MVYYLFLIVITVSLALNCLLGILTVIYGVKRRKEPDFHLSSFPKVSILKPFKHTDDEMENNVVSFFEIDYPDYEIIFGVDTEHDDTAVLLKSVMEKYPWIRAKIVYVGKEKIMNPKVETLAAMEKQSSGVFFWISDSNTRVEKNTLKRLVKEAAAGNAKLVFSLVRGIGARTLGSIMENSYMSFLVAGAAVFGWKFFGKPLIVGKSMLIERAALDHFGGFDYFKQYLAEDHIIGEFFKNNGFKISADMGWISNFNRTASVSHFFSRISRWAKMRFHAAKTVYFIEILANPVALAFFSVFFIGIKGLVLLAVCASVKTVIETVCFFAVNEHDRKNPGVAFLFPFTVVLKDIFLMVIYFLPFVSSRVKWRGKSIRIGAQSRIFVETEGA